MEINNNSFTQKSSGINKLSKNSPRKINKNNEAPKDSPEKDNILISQKNDLSIIQTRITGLESLKSAIEREPENAQSKIDEVLDKSQFHNQKILEPYGKELKAADPSKLPAKVDSILSQLKIERQEVLTNIEKTEITEQNKLSLASWNNQKNPEELLHQIVNSMENQNNLFNDIPIERIKDLLSD